ncbi:hypothetical protein KKF55_04815 [Patescibacteria group bacterium]|nr:hypothetical protein [Patescibacteria group bacterium]
MIERLVASGRNNESLAENVVDLMSELVHGSAVPVIQQSRDAIIEAIEGKWGSHHPNRRGGNIPLEVFPYNERFGLGMQIVRLKAFHAHAEHPSINIVAPGMVFALEGTCVAGLQTRIRNHVSVLSESGLHLDKREQDDRFNSPIPRNADKGDDFDFMIGDEERHLVETGVGVNSDFIQSDLFTDIPPDSGIFFREYIFSRDVRGGGR